MRAPERSTLRETCVLSPAQRADQSPRRMYSSSPDSGAHRPAQPPEEPAQSARRCIPWRAIGAGIKRVLTPGGIWLGLRWDLTRPSAGVLSLWCLSASPARSAHLGKRARRAHTRAPRPGPVAGSVRGSGSVRTGALTWPSSVGVWRPSGRCLLQRRPGSCARTHMAS